MKILNLYAGIGGNRKLWKDVEVTAVEINPEVSAIYQDLFPNDKVITGDAHQYLLEHFKEFDYIWSSPSCQSHSKFRKNVACQVREGNALGRWAKPIYPDLQLYEEVIFLQHYFKGKYCVENVVAYYEPLIKPQLIQRHWFWTNYPITDRKFTSDNIARGSQKEFERKFFDLTKYKVSTRKNGQSRSEVLEKDQILRNCVNPELGLYVFQSAFESPIALERACPHD